MGFFKKMNPLGLLAGGLLGGSLFSQPKPPKPPAPPPQAPNIASALSAQAQMKSPPLLGGTYLGIQGQPSTSGGKSLLGQ